VGWVDWTGFDQPAGLTGSGPSITWTASGSRLDIFLRGRNDKHVYQKSWIAGTGWSGWGDLGGIVESAPSASWVANGSRIDIFAIGADFRPYQKSWAAGAGWSDWIGFEPPPGASGSSPSVSWAADASRLDVFVTNEAEGATYQKTWSAAGGWTAWANM
jgi:hypothetical protein